VLCHRLPSNSAYSLTLGCSVNLVATSFSTYVLSLKQIVILSLPASHISSLIQKYHSLPFIPNLLPIMATPTSSIPERAAAVATASSTTRPVGDELVRATWLFQAGCALPTLFVLGVMAFAELFEPQIPLYDFMSVCHSPNLPASPSPPSRFPIPKTDTETEN
jgi:hypothetical protein